MKKSIEDIYLKYNEELDMINFEPDNCNDTIREYYVYGWYTNTKSQKYFYIGKGKENRYKHILKEIEGLKNSRKSKGIPYKILQDNVGIDCEMLYTNLTEKEAIVMEAYTMLKLFQDGQPLLNVIIPRGIMNNKIISKYIDEYTYYNGNEDKLLSYYISDEKQEILKKELARQKNIYEELCQKVDFKVDNQNEPDYIVEWYLNSAKNIYEFLCEELSFLLTIAENEKYISIEDTNNFVKIYNTITINNTLASFWKNELDFDWKENLEILLENGDSLNNNKKAFMNYIINILDKCNKD